MRQVDWTSVLDTATRAALEHLQALPDRPVLPSAADHEAILSVLDRPPTAGGVAAEQVVRELARDMEPYITGQAGGRYFGFVVGGLHPAALGAEVLVSAWDQNAPMFAGAPGVAVAEELAAQWLVDLLGLPTRSSVGFVTGGQMANFTCLAAARHEVFREVGWDVEARGLRGAPPLTVVVKAGAHATVLRALRFLGLGEQAVVTVACDSEDRVRPDLLREALAAIHGPTIMAVECGNVNTGAFDDFSAVADLADAHRAAGNPTWVHVDGAVMLLAAASPAMADRVRGLERLDSWSTDGHKLLNVAYDCGIALCRNAAAHRAAMSVTASYLEQDTGARDPFDWGPEFSRRARGVQVYATLRALGRDGLTELVDRVTALARRFAQALQASGQAEIVNEIASNQVLVRWRALDGDHGRLAETVMAAVRAEGTAFFTGTTYRGERLMRISVSDWATDEADVDRAVEALLRHARTANA
ncbi:pyridoxal phosphate-dependent decarboxylase family protein [Streptomyces sp. NPDC002499]